MKPTPKLAWLISLALATACGESPVDDVDAGIRNDAFGLDALLGDTGTDANSPDTGLVDAGFTDADPSDADPDARDATPGPEVVITGGTSRTLADAIAELAGPGTIRVTGTVTIDEDITVPAGVVLRVDEGGGFALDATLTIEGDVSAGLYVIFDSVVVFAEGSVAEVKSEWFGTEDLAVNYALLSAAAIPVRVTNDIRVDSAILLNSDQSLLLEGATLFPVAPVTGGAIIRNRGETNTNIRIIGGTIDGAGVSGVAYEAIRFENVHNSVIRDLTCNQVHISASADSGNITLDDCTYVTVENYASYDTWKAGIYVRRGHHNSILESRMRGCHDSGIALVDSHDSIIDGNYVDNCGTSDGSNIACGAERLVVTNNISINASGERNGNGITMGHAGSPATDSLCSNNVIVNNAAKGIFLQAGNTMTIRDNIVINNGVGNEGTNASGIANYSQFHVIENNTLLENRFGISLHNGSLDIVVRNNRIASSAVAGIRNDGISTYVHDNEFANAVNIRNDANSTNLRFEDNIETAPMPVDYSFLSDLPLTPLQLEVLSALFDL